MCLQLLSTQADAKARQMYEWLFGSALEGAWELKAAPFSPAVLVLANEELGVIGTSRLGSNVL